MNFVCAKIPALWRNWLRKCRMFFSVKLSNAIFIVISMEKCEKYFFQLFIRQ